VIVLNGDVGRHGSAIMSVREGLEFESTLESDCEELWTTVEGILNSGVEVHCMRDLTRGGLVSALNEIAKTSGLGVYIEEEKIPIIEEVRAICEVLGLDPLYVANEGRFIAIVPEKYGKKVASIMASTLGTDARIIGKITEENAGKVIMKSLIGSNRLLDMISSEQLPRIC
jgi:hydrogenase expression/formation protein HypE